MLENNFNRFILFCCSHRHNPFEFDPTVIVAFVKNCLHELNEESVAFARLSIITEVLEEIGIFFEEDPLDLPQVKDLFNIIKSVDQGLDVMLGTKSHRKEVLELTPDCKYTKFALNFKSNNFWKEASVQELLKGVFPKKNFEQGVHLTPRTVASILGVSLEMVFAHIPWIERPQVKLLY